MKDFLKGKLGTILILVTTVVLAGVAIFTAIRLYQLRSEPVAPNVPSSIPKAAEVSTCNLAFALSTSTPTGTPTATPTATPAPECNSVCTSSAACPSGQVCNIATGATTGNCRNASCLSDSDCVCSTGTPTPTGTPTATPTATPNFCNGTCGSNANCQSSYVCYNGYCRNPSCTTSANCVCGSTSTSTPAPSLPQSGTDWPTVAGFGIGILVILGSLLLAL